MKKKQNVRSVSLGVKRELYGIVGMQSVKFEAKNRCVMKKEKYRSMLLK